MRTPSFASADRQGERVRAGALDHLVAYNDWLVCKVEDSMAAAERGETVSDDDVRVWLEQRERA